MAKVNPKFRWLFPCLLFVLALGRNARAEVIKSFDVVMRAQSDTSLDVTENITMDFEGVQRHGIYRIIPVEYRRNGGNYTLYLDLLGVTDEQGRGYHYTTTRQGDDINIKIGDADTTITGVHIYQLHYMVRRAINFFGGAPEIYWNVTGNEWPFAMQNVTARVYPPPDVAVPQIKTASFAGPLGSTTPAKVEVENGDVLYSTTNLQPSEGLTLVAGLPAGSMTAPSALQTFLWFFADWWPAFVFPLLAGSTITFLWNKSGRDVEGNLPAQVEWSPPKDLSPAEVGTLIDESCDMADIVSTLIDLAARGYLRIEEIESQKILFFQSKDYAFHRNNVHNMDDHLAPHESEFLKGVFGSDATGDNTVLLSSLKNHFYTHLPAIRDSIYESLTQKNLFTQNPATTRTTYQVAGSFIMAAGVAGAIFLSSFFTIAYGIGLAIAGLIVLLSAKAMPAKTATGSRKLRECVGFQRFVQLAEKDRIQKLITDDPTIFGRLLPYAIVLGVGDEWANKFSGLLTQPPDWYSGSSYNTFSPTYFVNSLGTGMNSMGQTFSSQPKSTGGSGGSGFSGGGSGGGFGGGGGGSW